jgi:hypothetical protein
LSIWQDSTGSLLVSARTHCGWLLHQPPGAPPANAVDVASPSALPPPATPAAAKTERRAYRRPLLLLARLRGGGGAAVAAMGDSSGTDGCAAGPAAELRYYAQDAAEGTSSCLTFVVPAASVRRALQGGDQLAVLARLTVTQFANGTCEPVGAAILRPAGPAGPGVQQTCGGAVAVPYSTACSAAAATASILSAGSLEEGVAVPKRLSVAPAAVQRLQVAPSASAGAIGGGGGYGSYGGLRGARAA